MAYYTDPKLNFSFYGSELNLLKDFELERGYGEGRETDRRRDRER